MRLPRWLHVLASPPHAFRWAGILLPWCTGATVLLLLGGLALASGLVLLAGDQWLPRDRYWLAALMVMAIAGGIAAWFARLGLSRLSPKQLAPDQTVETLKEDKEWLKQQLTSGATSS